MENIARLFVIYGDILILIGGGAYLVMKFGLLLGRAATKSANEHLNLPYTEEG